MKISDAARQRYKARIADYQSQIKQLGLQESKGELAVKQQKAPNQLRVKLANASLTMVSYYLLMNELSRALLGVKNEGFLNEARKRLYKTLMYMEEIVTRFIDAPFSDYEEGVQSIDSLGDRTKLNFLRKLGFAIESVQSSYGDNTKWKWSFAGLDGRYAGVAKNMLNLKTYMAKLDPSEDGYSERLRHLELVKDLLQRAADRYREKYELSTLRIDDMRQAIAYLAALKRIYALLGEAEDADEVGRKADVWSAKMEADLRRSDKAGTGGTRD